MMTPSPASAAALILFAGMMTAGPAAAQDACPIQDQLVESAATQSADELAFTRTVMIEGRPKKGDIERTELVERFDPSAPEGERWTLVSYNGDAPTKKQLKEARQRRGTGMVPGYYRLATWLGVDPATCAPTEIRYDRFPKKTFDTGPVDMSGRMNAVAKIETDARGPMVRRTEFNLNKPFRVMLVAKITDFDVVSDYRRLADGRPVLDRQVMRFAGSRPGGSGTQTVVTTYSDYRLVR
ncbi:MAG: hypothetical protein V2J26_04360 [Pacificimonas sp.]|jgi:hypothetical protein|nr:hypothetical protein [Pacificimonas sp.]